MLTMGYIKENEKTYQVQIEELTNRVEYEQRRNQRKDKEIERLNNKLELISTIVEREFPPNEFITYKIKKILRGVDKE